MMQYDKEGRHSVTTAITIDGTMVFNAKNVCTLLWKKTALI